MKRTLLILCGPTATGKTESALELASLFNGELLSVDSRQVFKKMSVGTGKDVPAGFHYEDSAIRHKHFSIGFYVKEDIRLWGYDLLEPSAVFTVADFVRIGRLILDDMWSRGKLPILVGGTGHYIDSLLKPPDSLGVPVDSHLRAELNLLSVDQLVLALGRIDPDRLALMNSSDRYNSRRLIRAIEIAQYMNTSEYEMTSLPALDLNILWIGLQTSWEILSDRIAQRVVWRIDHGMHHEVTLLEQGSYDWNLPAFSATGYSLYRDYLQEELSLDELIHLWTTQELQYARRQMTWFKKNAAISWFDISDASTRKVIKTQVKDWIDV